MPQQTETLASHDTRLRPKPFQFYTSLVLEEATGLRASTLSTLVKLLETVPDSSLYHHTHYFLLKHHYLTPEPANDFAYWVSEILGEAPLGERLAGIDTMEHSSLASLRQVLVDTIKAYLARNPAARLRFVPEGREFFFMKATHVVMPTPYVSASLVEFAQALSQVSIRSLYFHLFDARLRVGHPTNDFAIWIGEQLGLQELAQRVARLDPYAHTLEAVRSILLSLMHQELARSQPLHA